MSDHTGRIELLPDDWHDEVAVWFKDPRATTALVDYVRLSREEARQLIGKLEHALATAWSVHTRRSLDEDA